MNQYQKEIEDGKLILRNLGVNLTVFKHELSEILENTKALDEDDWVMQYNTYAGCVGRTGYEPLNEWAKEFYQDHNKKEHRIWLKK